MAAITAGLIAGGLVGGGLIAQGIGAASAAGAAGKAATAELEEARRTRQLALEAAEPTVQEIQSLNTSIQFAEAANARQERILNATDPALIEAGEQALELLQGKDAAILDPIKRNRARTKEEFIQRLAARMGPGFETSTAGLRAINDFDAETDNLLAGAQLQAVGSLLGTSSNVRNQINPFAASTAFGNIAGAFGQQSNRRVAAITQTPITPFAGAPFVGAAGRGQALAGVGGGLAGIGGTILGGIAGGVGGLRFGNTNTIIPQPGIQSGITGPL